jgi:hypothetical protein
MDMNISDRVVTLTGAAAMGGAGTSWIVVAHEIVGLLGSVVALVAGAISIFVFIRNMKRGKTSATIQSDLKGPLGDVRSTATVDTERSDKAD